MKEKQQRHNARVAEQKPIIAPAKRPQSMERSVAERMWQALSAIASGEKTMRAYINRYKLVDAELIEKIDNPQIVVAKHALYGLSHAEHKLVA